MSEESRGQRVYTETTIPRFYPDVRTEPEMIARRNWPRTWWDHRRHAYRLVTTEAVIDELQVGTFPNQDQTLAFLAAFSYCRYQARYASLHKR
jgi:hypothetical protein